MSHMLAVKYIDKKVQHIALSFKVKFFIFKFILSLSYYWIDPAKK